MTPFSRLFGALTIAMLALPCAPALAAPVLLDHIEAELVSEVNAAQAGAEGGSEFWVALRLRPDAEWHTYWRNPGDSGLATRLQWTLPEGVSAGEIHWPYPHREALGELTNYGYSGETLHLVPIRLPADWPAGKPVELQARASWLVCRDICIPGDTELSLEVPTHSDANTPDPIWASFFAQTRAQLPVDVDWPARFTVSDPDISIAVDGVTVAADTEVDFFPFANDLVNHAAAQRFAGDGGDTLRWSQTLSDYFVEAPQPIEGVLVIHDGEPAHAYRIRATPGSVAPVEAAINGHSEASEAVPDGTDARPTDASTLGFFTGLVFAFLGGLVLNLMPCVFPVLSIKAVSLLESDEGRGGHLRHSLAYTGGVLICFAILAGVLLGLRGGGDAVGWGFQLQQPLFVAALAYLFFAMALSLSGLVHFGTRWMGVGQSLTTRGGLRGSFFTGVLAVVVASPCSAPFMGVALGYALTQPPAMALTVFLALGLGLASPFLLIGLVPALARLLPRPGAWMESFKQFMAFPLYLTVVWLLWVLGGLTDRSGMALAGIGLVLVAFVAWLWHRPGPMALVFKLAAAAGAIAVLAHPLVRTVSPPSQAGAEQHAEWQAYSPERLSAARDSGQTVFVNFTADWCITCKVNERVALSSSRVKRAFTSDAVVYLKGDWTRSDPQITEMLERYGRSGVPLYLLFRNGGEAEVLPQLLTPDIVIDSLQTGAASS